ncbi:MAG: MOSC domain-containing protein [Paracoccaceae bacterium]|nr:MOSC domain-containing protein [Paracoccaceae bacterium]
MTAHVAEIWRHPIKSLGAERVPSVDLVAGATIPYDRAWALAHEKTRFDFDAPEWTPCSAFLRCSIAPQFAAISARASDDGKLTLSHPKLGEITIDPDDAADQARLIAWVTPICPEGPGPLRLAKVSGRGMTDTDFPSVSIKSLASLRALSQRMGTTLNPRRFRGNLWLDGLVPWEEFDWVGSEITVGGARLKVIERVERCNATKANPETGVRDADTLGALETHYGHKDFGIYAQVIAGATVSEGDPVSAA